jgi:hypothetical protein
MSSFDNIHHAIIFPNNLAASDNTLAPRPIISSTHTNNEIAISNNFTGIYIAKKIGSDLSPRSTSTRFLPRKGIYS